MSRTIFILSTLWLTFGLTCGSIDGDNSHIVFRGAKRQASSGPCAGIVCAKAPESNCKTVDSGKGGINACCPDFECTSPDGTVSRHSGIAGSGSKGTSTTYISPDGKGFAKSHSTSSFSSSSSNSKGPGAMKAFSFNGPNPPALPPMPDMGPPPGFNMPKMPGFGKMPDLPGFGQMPKLPPLPKMGGPGFGPPPGFFDPPVWMKGRK